MLTFTTTEDLNRPDKEVMAFNPVKYTSTPFTNMKERDDKRCKIWLLPGLDMPHDSTIYKRSDEQISKDAYQCIEQHPLFDGSRIDLSVKQGKITINDIEPTLKEMLEQTLYRISGVSYVDNRLRPIALEGI